jgi:glutamate synthase domain-containing protein 3
VGDHGCEYMTGGTVVVLGATGRNFAAGMSGGVAYVLDRDGDFRQRVNHAMVAVEAVAPAAADDLRELVARHAALTGSRRAAAMVESWQSWLPRFVQVIPHEYRRVLEQRAAQATAAVGGGAGGAAPALARTGTDG